MSNTETGSSFEIASNGEHTVRPASLQLDLAKYRAEVDLFDITDEQKDELLTTLWSIMRSFVELGFTVDVCGALLSDVTPIPDDKELM